MKDDDVYWYVYIYIYMVMVLFLLLLVMDGVCGSVGSENVSE